MVFDAVDAHCIYSPDMQLRLLMLVVLAMLAFAGNSLLCRWALQATSIDAATFTSVRLVAGALTLWLLLRSRAPKASSVSGSWPAAAALFIYAAAFSFAYRSLTAATGALLLFGAVQATMLAWGFARGEGVMLRQAIGFLMAASGLTVLLLPGLTAPPLAGAVLMLLAGIAWGVYSLLGRGADDSVAATAGNFLRAVVFTLVLSAIFWPAAALDVRGIVLAVASGAITSALGYVAWYRALPSLRTVQAASVQLSVPVITAVGGVLLLGEVPSLRLVGCGVVILGGIALTLTSAAGPPGNEARCRRTSARGE